MAVAGKENGKRAYLSKDKRKALLLETAAAIVDEGGWSELTMMALAQRGQVSRQLVYQHFASHDALIMETISYIFADVYEYIRDEYEEHAADLVLASQNANDYLFGLPEGRAQALWQIMSRPYSEGDDVSAVSRRLRHLVSKITAPAVQTTLGPDVSDERARQVAWMLDMAFWGTWQMVLDGDLERKKASDMFAWMVKRIVQGQEVGPIPS